MKMLLSPPMAVSPLAGLFRCLLALQACCVACNHVAQLLALRIDVDINDFFVVVKQRVELVTLLVDELICHSFNQSCFNSSHIVPGGWAVYKRFCILIVTF